MIKHVTTCKNTTDSCEQEDIEEEATALGSNARRVRKLTGKTPDVQSVRDITGAVMEERRMEEIPLSTREQIPRHLSMERCKVTGESSKHTRKVRQQEVAEEPPQDHESDQEESEDEENLSEAS